MGGVVYPEFIDYHNQRVPRQKKNMKNKKKGIIMQHQLSLVISDLHCTTAGCILDESSDRSVTVIIINFIINCNVILLRY